MGKELLKKHSLRSEALWKNCLSCRSFQYRDHGSLVGCVRKTKVVVPVKDWTDDHYDLATRRAVNCVLYDDMRPILEL
jgi:hypothetical protein